MSIGKIFMVLVTLLFVTILGLFYYESTLPKSERPSLRYLSNIVDSSVFEWTRATSLALSLFEEDSPYDITLISQTSRERLFYLSYLKDRWGGQISIAVHTPREEEAVIRETIRQLGLPERVSLHIVLSDDPSVYPINYLRNVAIEHVTTSHFWVADMDMWPNWDLYSTLYNLSDKLLEDDHLAVIVPAFSYKAYYKINGCLSVLTCALLVKDEFPASKRELVQCLDEGNCNPFRSESKTHDYHFNAWRDLPPSTSITYVNCFPNYGQEPYIMVKKTEELPPFNSRFINYGFNKVQWIETLRYNGYKFAVLSQSFAIDIPHPDSSFAINWRSQWSLGKVAMKDLYDNYIADLHSKQDKSIVYICPPTPDASAY